MSQVDRSVLENIYNEAVETLSAFVRIPFVSVNENDPELMKKSANFVNSQFESVGLNTQLAAVKTDLGEGNTAVIGHLGANADGSLDLQKPTVLLYAHHDVQPANHPENWDTSPFEPTIKQAQDGLRMFGRGAADDGAGLIAHISTLNYYKKLGKSLPVNVKVFIEGEEEIGSPSFAAFIEKYKDDLQADVIIVADSSNWAVGVPAITTTLRGVATLDLELNVLEHSIHSGMSSGPIIDANALLMRVITSIWDDLGEIDVPGLLGAKGSAVDEPSVDLPDEVFRKDASVLEGVDLAGTGTISGRIWNKPSITVIGFDATPTDKSSNVFAPSSKARLSLRVAPGQDSNEAAEALIKHLESHVPFNAHFKVSLLECGPAFKAELDTPGALAFKDALEEGFGESVVYSGMGGSIPFTADLKAVFPNAEVLLAGVEDPDSRAHSDNESVNLDDLKKVITSEVHLLEKLAEKFTKTETKE